MERRFGKTPRPLVYKIKDLKNKLLRIECYRLERCGRPSTPWFLKTVIEHGSPHHHLINPNNGRDLKSPHLTRPGDEVFL